jgi:hypothetical protein
MSTAPPAAQSRLAELLAERVEWVTGRPPGAPGTSEPGTSEPGTSAADTTVLVLLRSLHLADLVHGAREFAAALDHGDAAAWRRSWTRTRFMFGNPANLTAPNLARVVAPGGTAAWLGPFPDTRRPGLGRLLKPVTGELPELPRDIDFPGTGPRRVLQVAVGGLTLAGYLVHLHHTLAEAVLLGRLAPGEPVRLSHRPALGAGPACGPPAYARVLPEPGDTGRLCLHTWLSCP